MADAKTGAHTPRPRREAQLPLVRQVFEACGELNSEQLSQAVAGMSAQAAQRMLGWMLERKLIEETRTKGKLRFYKLRQSGFKGWLQRDGEKRAAAAPAAPAAPVPAWLASRRSDGQVLIEACGQQLLLPVATAKALGTWLAREC